MMNPHKIILTLSIIGIVVTTATLIVALYKDIPFIAFLAMIGNVAIFKVVAIISAILIKDEDEC